MPTTAGEWDDESDVEVATDTGSVAAIDVVGAGSAAGCVTGSARDAGDSPTPDSLGDPDDGDGRDVAASASPLLLALPT